MANQNKELWQELNKIAEGLRFWIMRINFDTDWWREVVVETIIEPEIKKMEKIMRKLEMLSQPTKETALIDDTTIEQAKNVSILEIIPYQAQNLGRGRYKAKCPVHTEKTPSFVIYPDGGAHCFGCGAHFNNSIDYLMQVEHMDFKSAINQLRGSYGTGRANPQTHDRRRTLSLDARDKEKASVAAPASQENI